jgi:hypothetical protein
VTKHVPWWRRAWHTVTRAWHGPYCARCGGKDGDWCVWCWIMQDDADQAARQRRVDEDPRRAPKRLAD